MTPEAALAALEAHGNAEKAAQMAAYHKAPRRYLGLANADTRALATGWRKTLEVPERIALASALWDMNVFETRLAASMLFEQARIRPDDQVWALIQSWVPQFDSWAIADDVCKSGRRRLMALPDRIGDVERWTRSDHMWTRRAALVITLPWTKQRNPSPEDLAIRDRVLGWAAGYVDDPEWFIQKAVAWWLRDLSRKDPDRVRAFIVTHGAKMKPFARREAQRHL